MRNASGEAAAGREKPHKIGAHHLTGLLQEKRGVKYCVSGFEFVSGTAGYKCSKDDE